jgi:hypothetical protein
MIEDISVGKKKDMVLEYLLENPKVNVRSETIVRYIFPEINKDQALLLIRSLINTEENIVKGYDIDSTYPSIRCNGLTKPFLKQGGFSKIENDEINNSQNLYDSKLKDEIIKDLTIKNLELSNKQLKNKVLFSVIGFIAGIITLKFDIIIAFFATARSMI